MMKLTEATARRLKRSTISPAAMRPTTAAKVVKPTAQPASGQGPDHRRQKCDLMGQEPDLRSQGEGKRHRGCDESAGAQHWRKAKLRHLIGQGAVGEGWLIEQCTKVRGVTLIGASWPKQQHRHRDKKGE